ncbi:MAG: hypothetical protein CME59_03045 [Halioglobus sp.]|nr:hypothetical protein [Halioglobus sp.]
MSNDYDISFSYTVNNPGPAAAPQETDPTPYAFPDCEEFSLPNGAVLLVSKHGPQQTVVTRDVSIALGNCREFRSLQGHARFLTGYMPELGGDVDGVRKVLESVRDAGLMVPAQAFAGRLADGARGVERAPSRVFVITCDRPQAVERLLETLLAGADLARHERLYLVDDSRDADNAARNRELVQTFNTRSPRDMHYFGSQERETLLSRLLQQLPQHEPALRFLLDRQQWQGHKTFGLARTLCLLLSVGRRAIVLDDDVVCTAIEPPHRSAGIGFVERMCEADFYRSADAWMQGARQREEDPLAGHLSCLGAGLGDALDSLGAAAPSGEQLRDSQFQVLRRVTPASRILVTQNGTFGDPGTGDTSWVFNLTGPSLDRLLAGPSSIEDKVTTRQYWMGWSRPTFSNRFNMSQVTGLDNSALLPPYFPAWRGEDQLFGAMLEYLYPDSLVLNYPWAVPHLPLDERSGSITPAPEVAAGAALVETHIGANAPDNAALPLESRLASLVLLFEQLAGRGDEDLAAAYRTALAADQANAARQVADKLRQAPEAHGEWRQLLEERGRHYMQAIGRAQVPVRVSGVPESMDEAELWRRGRELAGRFAAALAAWPAVREAAAELARDA